MWDQIECNIILNSFLDRRLNRYTLLNLHQNISCMAITVYKVFIEYHSIEDVHSLFGNQRIHNMLGGYIIGDWLSINEGFDQDRLANVGILHDWEYNLIITFFP